MKKALSALLAAALLASCAAVSPSAAAEDAGDAYVKTDITTYPYADDSEPVTLTCLTRSDLPGIPFLSVGDYLGQLYTGIGSSGDLGGGVYRFSNAENNMTVDAQKDTVSFDSYEGFLFSNSVDTDKDPMPYPFIEDGRGMEFVGEVKGVEFDLSKYGIDVVERDGVVYMPFCTLNELFTDAEYVMNYSKESLYVVSMNSMISAKGIFSTRTKETARFIYDEFCFAVDCFSGKPSSALFTEGIVSDGLDKTLDTYDSVTPRIKELLLSENAEDFAEGVMLLQYYMDDGGHTQLTDGLKERLLKYGVTNMSEAASKVFGDDSSEEIAAIISDDQRRADVREVNRLYGAKKAEAYKSFEEVKDWGGSSLYRSGDTFIFDLSGFGTAAIEPFKWSLDYAAENGGKNFIIDVTGNLGGEDAIAAYMIALMCGDARNTEQLCASGNKRQFTKKVDKNLDGKFDEADDAVKYDFRFAVLAGAGSYSCANTFPCMAQDRGICVIGEQTPGGNCCGTTRLFANGTSFKISGYTKYLRENGKDSDKGVTPDVAMPGKDAGYNGFYDIGAFNKGIAEFYGDPVPEPTGLCGDADGDGSITSTDALMILRQSIGLEDSDDKSKAITDVDGDSFITADDALAVLRYSVGFTDHEKIGKAV